MCVRARVCVCVCAGLFEKVIDHLSNREHLPELGAQEVLLAGSSHVDDFVQRGEYARFRLEDRTKALNSSLLQLWQAMIACTDWLAGTRLERMPTVFTFYGQRYNRHPSNPRPSERTSSVHLRACVETRTVCPRLCLCVHVCVHVCVCVCLSAAVPWPGWPSSPCKWIGLLLPLLKVIAQSGTVNLRRTHTHCREMRFK